MASSTNGGTAITDAETNPYGVPLVEVLEDEIYALLKDVETHKTLSRAKDKTKAALHKKMLKIKRQTIERLMGIHPNGEGAFLA